MIMRSVANELPGPAAVRPASQASSWKPPWMAMSQWTMPFGPQAAQAMIASSTSDSGTTACSDWNASGPRSCLIDLPVADRCSSSPDSIE
jgi:hypothetical protein